MIIVRINNSKIGHSNINSRTSSNSNNSVIMVVTVILVLTVVTFIILIPQTEVDTENGPETQLSQ